MPELIRIYRESAVANLEQVDGFKGALLLTNEETGKMLAISLWDSEENAARPAGTPEEEAHRRQDLFTLAFEIHSLLAARGPDEIYEVSFMTQAQPGNS
jgi:heme-degrading monooxygenase HmoA